MTNLRLIVLGVVVIIGGIVAFSLLHKFLLEMYHDEKGLIN